jgi:SAM-dependent methyltransferase
VRFPTRSGVLAHVPGLFRAASRAARNVPRQWLAQVQEELAGGAGGDGTRRAGLTVGLAVEEERDWRVHFTSRLTGQGLEIGALHSPMIKHPRMRVEYVDRLSVSELRAQYPELAGHELVEPDILADGETLEGVPDGKYDFLIASHVLEHMRNPLRALESWCRVVRPGGLIYLPVPDKRFTFDERRPRTTLEHLIADYRAPSPQRDFEHFLDYAAYVNGQSGDEAIAEARRLVEVDYSIHFHVFVPEDVVGLLEWFAKNVRPIEVVEGPAAAPRSHEFHLLVRVPA